MVDNATLFVRHPDGQRFGPATTEIIFEWIDRNSVSRDAIIEDSATGTELPISQMPEFASRFSRDAGDLLIPKNAGALISYYVGIFAFVGTLVLVLPGFILGIVALVFGIRGWRYASRNPLAHGKIHALVGIVCGTINILIGLALMALIIVAMLTP